MHVRTLLVTAALLIGGQADAAEIPSNVFQSAQALPVWQGELSNTQIRMRMVEFGNNAVETLFSGRVGEVELNLFNDVTLVATTELLERDESGGFQWRGRFTTPGYYAILTQRGGETAGIVRAPEGTFEIIPSGNGVSRIAEVHMGAFARCGVDANEFAANPLANEEINQVFHRTLDAEHETSVNSSARGAILPTLDQLVAYTPDALSWIGGSTSGMSAFIDSAIADMNAVFDNNGIPMQTRVVFKHALTENETGDAFGDRNDFRINNDGKWDEVHQLRNDFGADVCHILVRDSNACGIAAMIYRRAADSADFAFCLTAMGCVSNSTFTHEVGHLMGGAHDIVNAGGIGGAGTFSYSFGWRDPDDATWRTIMSYAPGARIPYFSTPDINHADGQPLGSSTLADNSRTFSLNVDLMTAWRGSVGLAPENLSSLAAPGEIQLSWDSVAQAVQYQIWRSATDNSAQSQLRGVTVDTTFTDTNVIADTTYYYFTKASFVDGGVSPFSDSTMATAIGSLVTDLSGDGVVNSVDLAILLAAWGTPGADFSADGTTDSVDLAILLAAWG